MPRQTNATRLCGFFAVANAFSCWMNVDPTGMMYDERLLREHLHNCFETNVVSVCPSVRVDTGKNENIVVMQKLHCICKNARASESNTMIQCGSCENWFHEKCVNLKKTDTPLRNRIAPWKGPCCDSDQRRQRKQII